MGAVPESEGPGSLPATAIAKKAPSRHLRVATLLLLGIVLTAGGWFGTSPGLLDAGLVVTAGGVLYGVLQLAIRGNS